MPNRRLNHSHLMKYMPKMGFIYADEPTKPGKTPSLVSSHEPSYAIHLGSQLTPLEVIPFIPFDERTPLEGCYIGPVLFVYEPGRKQYQDSYEGKLTFRTCPDRAFGIPGIREYVNWLTFPQTDFILVGKVRVSLYSRTDVGPQSMTFLPNSTKDVNRFLMKFRQQGEPCFFETINAWLSARKVPMELSFSSSDLDWLRFFENHSGFNVRHFDYTKGVGSEVLVEDEEVLLDDGFAHYLNSLTNPDSGWLRRN